MTIFSLKLKKEFLFAIFLGVLCASPFLAHAQTPAPAAGTSTYNPSQPTTASNHDPLDTTTYLCKEPIYSTATCTSAAPNPDGSTVTCNYVAFQSFAGGCVVTYPNNGGTTNVAENGTVTNIDPTGTQVGQTTTQGGVASIVAPVAQKVAGAAYNFLAGAAATAAAGVAFIVLNFAAGLLALIGTLFNWIIVITIFQFGNYFGNSTGLLTAWGVLRDVGNIVLLFGFVYIGVMMILDIHSFDARKALPRLLIVAVLMNFSLFGAEAVIDTSNVLSAVLFKQSGQSVQAIGCTSTDAISCAASGTGIADQIIQASGLGNIWTSTAGLTTLTKDPAHTAVVFLGLAIFVSIMCVVLLAASIMLAIRAIVLTLVMVSAPLGLTAMAIPQLYRFGKQWLDMLLSQAFFAPVYLLLVYVGLKIMNGLQGGVGGTSSSQSLFAALNTSGTTYGTVLIVFALVIGFMVAALMAAKSMGALGASFATNTASRMTFGALTRATNFGIGGTGYILRKGIQASPIKNTGLARGLVAGTNLMEKTNFDLRRVGVGNILKAAGATDGANAATHATFGDMQHIPGEVAAKFKAGEKEYNDQIKNSQLEKNAHDAHGGDLNDEDQRYLSTLGVKQLETMHGIQEGVESLAKSLSPQQFEDLMKSEKLSDSAKDNLRNNRFKSATDVVAASVSADAAQKAAETIANAPGATQAQIQAAADAKITADNAKKAAKKVVQGMSEKDFEQLAQSSENSELYNNEAFAALLTDDQFTKAKGNQRIVRSQRDQLQVARDKRFSVANAPGAIDGMSAEAIGKLSGDILKQQDPNNANRLPNGQPAFHVIAAMSGEQISKLDMSKLDTGTINAINDTKFVNRPVARATLQGMSSDAIGKLPVAILSKPDVIGSLTAEQLSGLQPNLLDPVIMGAIQGYIRNNPNDQMVQDFITIVGSPPAVRGTNPGAEYNWAGKI